ncbi:hypothetical protein DINM_004779 [Dirofilaria immitis]|nr:hypothetical protein [Dirofilaria immitis]
MVAEQIQVPDKNRIIGFRPDHHRHRLPLVNERRIEFITMKLISSWNEDKTDSYNYRAVSRLDYEIEASARMSLQGPRGCYVNWNKIALNETTFDVTRSWIFAPESW